MGTASAPLGDAASSTAIVRANHVRHVRAASPEIGANLVMTLLTLELRGSLGGSP